MPEPSTRFPEEILLQLLDGSFDSMMPGLPEQGFVHISPAFEQPSGYRADEPMADPTRANHRSARP